MTKHKLVQNVSNAKNRGFTIIELLVVVIVIGILTTVGIYNFINIQKKSADNDIAANALWISHQLDKYRADHGEYPLMEDLNPGNNTTNITMTDFSAAAAILNVKTDFLSDPTAKFHTLCAAGCSVNPQKNQYEYVALTAAANNSHNPFSWNANSIGCSITIDWADPAYVMVYFNSYQNVWIFKKSARGTASVANIGGGPSAPQTCTFTT